MRQILVTETDDQIGATEYSETEAMRVEVVARAQELFEREMSTMRSSEGSRLTEARLRTRQGVASLLLTLAPGEVWPVAPPADLPHLPGAQPLASAVPRPQNQGQLGSGTEATLIGTLWSLTAPVTAPLCPEKAGGHDTSPGLRPFPRRVTPGPRLIWTRTLGGRDTGTMKMATPVITAQAQVEVGQ